jgi:hypothetical protein
MARFSWGNIMDIIKKINELVVVTGHKLRGFKSKKAMGKEIEKMEWDVEHKDILKFDKILNKYLDKVDPKSKFDIATAISKLKDKDAVALYDELLNLHYKDEHYR